MANDLHHESGKDWRTNGIDDRPLVCPGRLMSMSAIGTKRTTLPDYVAIGGLFALAVWAAADLHSARQVQVIWRPFVTAAEDRRTQTQSLATGRKRTPGQGRIGLPAENRLSYPLAFSPPSGRRGKIAEGASQLKNSKNLSLVTARNHI